MPYSSSSSSSSGGGGGGSSGGGSKPDAAGGATTRGARMFVTATFYGGATCVQQIPMQQIPLQYYCGLNSKQIMALQPYW